MSQKTGLYLGKFAPFHGGHQYCVDTMLDECDHGIVLVYYTEKLDVPLQQRAQWIRDLYSDEVNGGSEVDGATLDVIEAWTGPEAHGYSDEIKTAHEEYVIELLRHHGYDPRPKTGEIDAFYSSEPYGEHMAEALGADDRRVDPDRETMPISATMVREEGAHKHQGMLADRVYRDLVTNVAIVGGVSTGKTTLAEALADHYDTAWMPEHGREYWKEHADENGQLSIFHLERLAKQHLRQEDEKLADADEYLFTDTTPLTTMAWSKYYHGEVYDGLREIVERQENERYDLHVLCDPDIPFESDPGRDGRQNRKRLHRMTVALMEQYNIDYITVDGSVEERVEQVAESLNRR